MKYLIISVLALACSGCLALDGTHRPCPSHGYPVDGYRGVGLCDARLFDNHGHFGSCGKPLGHRDRHQVGKLVSVLANQSLGRSSSNYNLTLSHRSGDGSGRPAFSRSSGLNRGHKSSTKGSRHSKGRSSGRRR